MSRAGIYWEALGYAIPTVTNSVLTTPCVTLRWVSKWTRSSWQDSVRVMLTTILLLGLHKNSPLGHRQAWGCKHILLVTPPDTFPSHYLIKKTTKMKSGCQCLPTYTRICLTPTGVGFPTLESNLPQKPIYCVLHCLPLSVSRPSDNWEACLSCQLSKQRGGDWH